MTYGTNVNEHLKSIGVETPMFSTPFSDKQKIKKLESLFEDAHQVLGIDVGDDSIADTPTRIAKLLINESMSGLDYNNFPKITLVDNKFGDSHVTVTDILVSSLCEHHWERVIMRVSISYIPDKKVLGLSKFARLAEFFGNRPIIQERYTKQLHAALCYILNTKNVAVHVRGIHMCMFARGVKSPCSNTNTIQSSGDYIIGQPQFENFMSNIDLTKPIIPV